MKPLWQQKNERLKSSSDHNELLTWAEAACKCLVRATYSALPDVKEAAQQLVEEIGYEGSRKMSKSDGEG